MEELPRFKLERMQWTDEELGHVRLPKGRLTFTRSFGSGLSRRASDPLGQIWATGDRGPNIKIKTMLDRYGAEHLRPLETLSGAKVMPRLDIGPHIARLKVEGGRVHLLESFAVTDGSGRPVSGLPMRGSQHASSEPAFDLDGNRIAPDPSGLDPEGIVALEDGTFILSDEFGPSLVRLDRRGRVRCRYVPEGSVVTECDYPVHATLPALAGRRQLNRGFEAVAVSADQKSLFVAFQSPLARPDETAHRNARHVRLWRLDLGTFRADEQYLYPLEAPDTFLRDSAKGRVKRSDLKISEIVCLSGDSMLVLERASETSKIYRVTLRDPLPIEHFESRTRPTVEEMSAEGDPLPALDKLLLFSSDHVPELSADLEGMAILSPNELVLVNDNDFGIEGVETSFWKLRFDAPILI